MNLILLRWATIEPVACRQRGTSILELATRSALLINTPLQRASAGWKEPSASIELFQQLPRSANC